MTTVTCTGCDQDKPIDQFSKGKLWAKGTKGLCKPCNVKATQEKQRTLSGLIKKIYHNQRMTTGKMGRAAPEYTEADLLQWAMAHGLQQLHATWEASNYDKWLSPSVDRRDNTKSYTLDNIQLLTWRENLDNQKAMNIAGTYLHTGSKAVDQFTLDEVFIKTFPSIACAMREVAGHRKGVTNITAVCEGKWPTAYGFKWRWSVEALS